MYARHKLVLMLGLFVLHLTVLGTVSMAGRMGGGGGGGMMIPSSPPTVAFQAPLPIPTVLTPTIMTDHMTGMTYDLFQMDIKPGQARIIPGLITPIWGYNGTFPGPTIKVKSGRTAVVRFRNLLPEGTVVHLHGGHIPVEQDGHAMDIFGPGTTRDYIYPNMQQAATLWYHPHPMDKTGPQVWKGLAGFYIIEDDFEAALPLPKGAQDVALAIQDRLFNANGSFNYPLSKHTIMHGMLGDVLLVNGAVQPYFRVATRKYRFRILNGSNASQYELALSNGKPLVQIGSDGGLLPAPVTRSSILISPGERVEVVVDFAGYALGTKIILKNRKGSGRTADIMRFDVTRKEAETASIPIQLRPVPRMTASDAVRTRVFTLGMDMMSGMMTINGKVYDHMRVDADPALGTTEIWEFVNPTMMWHPMHAHAIQWQVLDINGAFPPAYDAGWKDTWLVPPGGKVRVIGTFTDYVCDPNPMMHHSNYMIHCHILEHEDHGMMAQFKVLGDGGMPPM